MLSAFMFALSDVLHLKPPSSTTDHLYKRYTLDAFFMNVPMVFHHLNWTTQTLLCLSLSDTQIDKVSEFPRFGCSSLDIRSNIRLQPCTKCFVSDCSVFDLVSFVFNCQNYSVIDFSFKDEYWFSGSANHSFIRPSKSWKCLVTFP